MCTTLNNVDATDVEVASMVKGRPRSLTKVRLERLRRVTCEEVLTVVLTLSIVMTWSVALRPHESRRRKSKRHVQTFTSLGRWLTRLCLQSHTRRLVADGNYDDVDNVTDAVNSTHDCTVAYDRIKMIGACTCATEGFNSTSGDRVPPLTPANRTKG